MYIEEIGLESETLAYYIDNKLKRHQSNAKYIKNEEIYNGKLREIYKKKKYKAEKVNNKLCHNFTKTLIDSFDGYFLGQRVSFTTKDQDLNLLINNILKDSNFLRSLPSIVHNTSIYGSTYLYVYINENKKLKVLNIPRQNVIIEKDSDNKTKSAIVLFEEQDFLTEKLKFKVLYITLNYIYTFEYNATDSNDDIINFSTDKNSMKASSLVFIPEETVENPFNKIPVVEFLNTINAEDELENIIQINDKYDKVMSDALDNYEQMCHTKLIIKNAVFEDKNYQLLAESNLLLLNKMEQENAGEPDAKFVEKAQNTEVTSLLAQLQKDMETVSKIPFFNLLDINGGNTNVLSIKTKINGLLDKTKLKEELFLSSLDYFFDIVKEYIVYKCFIENINVVKEFQEENIEVKFYRPIFTNFAEEADTFVKLNSTGQLSTKTLLETLSFIPNALTEIQAKEIENTEKPQENEEEK